jgi:hypothetical protein
VRLTNTHLLRAEVKNEYSYAIETPLCLHDVPRDYNTASGKFLNAYDLVKEKNSAVSTHMKSCRLSMRQGEIDISVSILNSCQGSPVARPSNHAAPQREVEAQLCYYHELCSWRSSNALLLTDSNLFLGCFMKILPLSSRYLTRNILYLFDRASLI